MRAWMSEMAVTVVLAGQGTGAGDVLPPPPRTGRGEARRGYDGSIWPHHDGASCGSTWRHL